MPPAAWGRVVAQGCLQGLQRPIRADLLERQPIRLLLVNHRRQVGQLALEPLSRWGIAGRRQEQVLHVPAHHLEGGHGRPLFCGMGDDG
jgi:hypothetical protein